MKKAMILSALLILGCALPKSSIAPQYDGQDASTLMVWRESGIMTDAFLQVDGAIVSILESGSNQIKSRPGRRVLQWNFIQSALHPVPIACELPPNSTRYFKATKVLMVGPVIEEIDEYAFRRLTK